MSFNANDKINLSNYEEWFVLYVDNELRTEEKAMVEAFLLLHPNLQDEMDVLLSTKLPAGDVLFLNKENLTAEAMKLNAVDEDLLLYIDNELSSADERRVEEKVAADEALQLQYNILLQTKLDAAEAISHPNKKELYRHTEKVISLSVWMRVAAAVVLILFATIFFVVNRNTSVVVTQPDVAQGTKEETKGNDEKRVDSFNKLAPVITNTVLPQSMAGTKTDSRKKAAPNEKKTIVDVPQKQVRQQDVVANEQKQKNNAVITVELIKAEVKKLTEQPAVAINNSSAISLVTSSTPDTYNNKDPNETAGSNGAFTKKTSAKGLLRKVSRFIGRRTGIGSVNADNEMLVGMVALKLN